MAIGILVILIALQAILPLLGIVGSFQDNAVLYLLIILVEIAGIATVRVWVDLSFKRKRRV